MGIDQPTDQPSDEVSYRGACSHLKALLPNHWSQNTEIYTQKTFTGESHGQADHNDK
jgi:hypothetical protein